MKKTLKDKAENIHKCVCEIYNVDPEDQTEYPKKLPFTFDEDLAKHFLKCCKKYNLKIKFIYTLLFRNRNIQKCPFAEYWGFKNIKIGK